MRQLSFFEDFSQVNKVFFRLHDKVKVIEVQENTEIHDYRKYYYPHILGKTGIVTKAEKNAITVRIDDEEIIFDVIELEWIA